MALTEIKTSGIADDAVTTDKLANAINTERTGKIANVVEDTSPQLGADLDVNDFNIKNGTAILDITQNQRFEFNVAGSEVVDINSGGVDITSGHVVLVDNVKAKIGSGTDLEIFHDGTDSHIDNNNGDLYLTTTGTGDDVHIRAVDDVQIKVQGNENAVICSGNGSVDLYHANSKKLETSSGGIVVTGQMYSESAEIRGAAGGDSVLNLFSDGGQHDADKVRIRHTHVGNSLLIESYASGAYQSILKGTDSRSIELHYQGSKKLETFANGMIVYGPEGGGGLVNIYADEGDDNADKWRLHANPNGSFYLQNYTSGSWESNLAATGDGATSLYHNDSVKLETTSVGVNITGQTTYVRNSSGDANLIVGSQNAGGAYIVLDGDSNGDGAGGDYAYLFHDTSGNFNIIADNPAGNSELRFYSGSANLRCKVDSSGNFIPTTNNAHDLGTSSYRWRNVYTNDLNLSNEGSKNDVDGTWGDYQIQEGESDLFLINKRSGKKFKFMLQEVS